MDKYGIPFWFCLARFVKKLFYGLPKFDIFCYTVSVALLSFAMPYYIVRESVMTAVAKKVKIRLVSNGSIVVSLVLSVLCITISIFGFTQYVVLRSAMNDYIACENAVHELQEGSDNLTKQARLAAATGETAYIDAYFEEADVTQNREHALQDLDALNVSDEALTALKEALSNSVSLMQTEYYSMRLVEESTGTAPAAWPEELRSVTLTAEDAALSPEEQLYKAQQLVTGPDYVEAKEKIADSVNAAVSMLTDVIDARQSHADALFIRVFFLIIACVFLFAIMMLLVCLLMRYWIVSPLLQFNHDIERDAKLTLGGANELQTLAATYNKIFEENEEKQRLIKHQAEHDPLTDLLNRGAYDRILELYQSESRDFALILVDVDTFKSVNDGNGHAVGDAILKKVARLLTVTFRNIDYICRIGGDEFAIIMVEMTSDLSYTITEKITEINRQLSNPDDGLPPVSLSVGVAFTDRKDPGKSQFTDADSALYYTKEHGKHGCTFYPAPKE